MTMPYNIPMPLPEAPEFSVNELLNQEILKSKQPGFDYEELMQRVGPMVQGLLGPEQQQQQQQFGAVPQLGGGGGGLMQAPTMNPQMVTAPGSPAQNLQQGQLPGQQNFSIAPGGGASPGPSLQLPGSARAAPVQVGPTGGGVAPTGPSGGPAGPPAGFAAAQPQAPPQPDRGGLLNWHGGMGTGLAKIFGGPGTGQLTPAQRQQAGWQGLTQAGLGMIAAGGPKPYGVPPTSGMQQIGAGIERGMQGYQQAAGGIQAAGTASAIRDAMRTGNPNALEDAYRAAVAGGDLETANAIGPILQSVISASGSEGGNLQRSTDPLTGEAVWNDPRTGLEIMRFETPEDIMPPGFQAERQRILSRFTTNTADFADVANSYKRVLSATNTLLQHEQNKAAAQAAGTPYSTPYAATMAAISSFARLLDPNSVVRTEEFKIVTNQGSLEEKLRNWWEMLTEGTLTEDIAQAIQDEAWRQTSAQRSSYEERMQQAWKEADVAGMEKAWVPLTSPFEAALNLPRGAHAATVVPPQAGQTGTVQSDLDEVVP